VSNYGAVYDPKFVQNLQRFASMRQQIKRRVERILANPYVNTELLGGTGSQLNLRGCRSARVDRNFRIIFVICEECRRVPACLYCFCDKETPDRTVVFLTVGPHSQAYIMG
jgi:mRNA-degrading endonuclease RelE of RelBE toxin-antitoxin system